MIATCRVTYLSLDPTSPLLKAASADKPMNEHQTGLAEVDKCG